MKVKELILALNEFNENDIVVLSTCDAHGDEIDLFNFYIDVIQDCSGENNTKFTEVRICQIPN